ncbi:MAG: NUDIX hydrolase [Pseudomonadota bacterium]|jgi:8-oxo-dGTP pyrophosphatase MutT (NUDIX family)|nr:NUDIX hydrolase [Pseudomonadota bacterium]
MHWTPYVVVTAIIERDGRFLMVEEEAEGRIVINQPAGHLEQGETLFEAVKREVLEETAWHIEPEGLVGLYLYAKPYTDIAYLRVCFRGISLKHEPDRPLDEGIVRALWLSREEIFNAQYRHRSPLVLRCVDDYLAGKRYPLDVLYHLPFYP